METTFKQYLENRIEDLRADIRTHIHRKDWSAEANSSAKLQEVLRIYAEYESQCIQILGAVGISQEQINAHVGYTERECIKFADWIAKSEDWDFSTYPEIGTYYKLWKKESGEDYYDMEADKARTITTEELYKIYQSEHPEENRGETSTEGPDISGIC